MSSDGIDGTQVWDITFYVLFRCVEFGLVYQLKFQIGFGISESRFEKFQVQRRVFEIHWHAHGTSGLKTEGNHSVIEMTREPRTKPLDGSTVKRGKVRARKEREKKERD